MAAIEPLTAGAVFLATAATDAVYVMFTSAVVARTRLEAKRFTHFLCADENGRRTIHDAG